MKLGFLGLNRHFFDAEALDQSTPPHCYVRPSFEPLAHEEAPQPPEDREGMTHAEIAAVLGLSRERVRQIEVEALRKLAKALARLKR